MGRGGFLPRYLVHTLDMSVHTSPVLVDLTMSSDSTTDPSPTRSASGATSPTSVGSPDAASPSNLDIKFVDSRWFEDDDTWNLKYVDTEGESIAAEKVQPVGVTTASDDSWDGYCFVVVREYSKPKDKDDKNLQISFKVIIKSAHLLKACMEVMGTLRGVSWNSPPVTVRFLANCSQGTLSLRHVIARAPYARDFLPQAGGIREGAIVNAHPQR